MSEPLAVRVAIPGISVLFSYSLSEGLSGVEVGSEVLVELGRRQTKGWVVEKGLLNDATQKLPVSETKQLSLLPSDVPPRGFQLKPILTAAPAFPSEQLALFSWMVDYYGSTLGEVIDNAVPERRTGRESAAVTLSAKGAELLASNEDFLTKLSRRAPVQARILSTLATANNPLLIEQLKSSGKNVSSAVKLLAQKNLVELQFFSGLSLPLASSGAALSTLSTLPISLTASQEQALKQISESIEQRTFSPFLLFGVTGSGKTEIYLRAVKEVLASGGSALIIVPEISLTPQLLDYFQSRLNIPVAVIHSQVGGAERWSAWQAALSGKQRVALGARSAVFAPLQDLRLVIVDEEHDSSYKQSEGLRYHGRDVAIMRAKFAKCPIILGSATPSFESLLNAQRGRYRLLELPHRATSRPVPLLEVVDLNKIKRREMPSENLSPQLHQAILETLASDGQVVILYNRRGFSSYLQCESCAEAVSCSNCSVTLTYHRKKGRLVCHYCGLTIDPPEYCQFCRDPRTTRKDETLKNPERGKLTHRGGGTERIVDELLALFPSASIARMDRDTVGEKGAYRRILNDVRTGKTDILVGTQMIAKGHDLPGVTLVGIIDADVGLHLPDFRATEKVYQLIVQAAGRAGRGTEPGRVLVQTREPNHPTIVATKTDRFKAFARYELEHRKALNYPPWGRILRLVVSSKDRLRGRQISATVRTVVDQLLSQLAAESTAVLGPAAAPHERLRGWYRFHLLIKSGSSKTLSQLAKALHIWKHDPGTKSLGEFRLAIDIDAVDML